MLLLSSDFRVYFGLSLYERGGFPFTDIFIFPGEEKYVVIYPGGINEIPLFVYIDCVCILASNYLPSDIEFTWVCPRSTLIMDISRILISITDII